MRPADPDHRSEPERDPYEADEAEQAEQAEAAGGPGDLETLRKNGDVEGLLALAKAHRAGRPGGARDMTRCLAAYRAAAELGSAEAEYAVALFQMNGGSVVAQDLKDGTMHLRSAAEKGSIPAKVYLGNLYELGIHYKADAEKADVWYRNAARAAHVDAEPGTEDWDRALAELGCARHVLALQADPSVSADDKQRLLFRAKAHGHGLRVREAADSGDRATFVDALAGAEASAEPRAPHAGGGAGAIPSASGLAAPLEPRQRKDTSPETKRAKLKVEETRAKSIPPPQPSPVAEAGAERAQRAAQRKASERQARIAGALGAFGYALLFALAGAAAAYAATLGARVLIANGHVLPIVGTSTRLVFPIVLGVVGVLPAWLVYRFGALLKALVMGAAVAGIGWVAWGTGRGAFHADRPLQALAFGLCGFLAGLFVLGLMGGAKQPRPVARPR